MKLTYRGIAYEKPSFALDTELGDIKGRYRGQDWQCRYPKPIPRLHLKPPSTYRGSAQHIPAPAQRDETGLVSPWEAQKVITHELSQMHFENIRKSLEKRLQVAEEKGDIRLIRLLNQEFEQLAAIS